MESLVDVHRALVAVGLALITGLFDYYEVFGYGRTVTSPTEFLLWVLVGTSVAYLVGTGLAQVSPS